MKTRAALVRERSGFAEQWIQQGRTVGRQEGREEGREGLVRTALNLLQHRFGTVDSDLDAEIRHLSLADLERLIIVTLDAPTFAVVVQWVGAAARSR